MSDRDVRIAWSGVLVLVIITLARAPISDSYWLDETLSIWITNSEAADVWNRTVAHQGQSPFYYLLLWFVRSVLGASEIAMRLPSICLAALSLFVTARITSKLALPRLCGPVAVAILLSSDGFQVAAFSARPYALAILCVFLSILFLIQYSEKNRAIDGFAFVVTALATFYAHYLFAAAWVVYVAAAWMYRAKLRNFLLCAAIIGIGSVPGLFQLRDLASRSGELSFSAPASVAGFLRGTFPAAPLVSTVIALLLALIWGVKWRRIPIPTPRLLLLIVWTLGVPALFVTLSLVGQSPLLVARYWVWQQGGLAILLAAIAATASQDRRGWVVSAALFVGLAFWGAVRPWQVEDWRGASGHITKGNFENVILYPGLIEVESPQMRSDPAILEYLKAPLQIYGTHSAINLVSIQNAAELSTLKITGPTPLVTIRAARRGGGSPTVFLDALRGAGFTVEPLTEGGLVQVFIVRQ